MHLHETIIGCVWSVGILGVFGIWTAIVCLVPEANRGFDSSRKARRARVQATLTRIESYGR